MRKLLKMAGILFVCSALSGFYGCLDSGQQGNGASGGFPVSTYDDVEDELGNLIGSFPHGGAFVVGSCVSDASSSAAGSVRGFQTLTDESGLSFVTDGRVYANWYSTVNWETLCVQDLTKSDYFFNVTPTGGISWICVEPINSILGSSTHFVLPSSLPTTLIYNSSSISASYGAPVLNVFGPATGQVAARSVASGTISGQSATFPFPTTPNGASLTAPNLYGLNVLNIASDGTRRFAGASYLAIGGETSEVTAFGVDAVNVTTKTTNCIWVYNHYSCNTTPTTTTAYPVVTQYSSNQVSYRGNLIPVGPQPTAVRAFGSVSGVSTQNSGRNTATTYTTQPSRAIVTNFGAGSVSLIGLAHPGLQQTIAVGSQPCAVEVNPDGSLAWVANYGSATVTEISLQNNAVSRTVAVGQSPAALAYDPDRNAVWVGGAGYIQEIDLNSFGVVQSIPVAGDVTSLAYSHGNNELVYSMISNNGAAFSPGSNPPSRSEAVVQEMRLSDNTVQGSYPSGSIANYESGSMNGTLAVVSLLARGSLVSANYGNDFAIIATPSGFSVLDIPGHSVFMQGSTPTPVRSIAVDPAQGVAYLTVPQSNELIQVPLPRL